MEPAQLEFEFTADPQAANLRMICIYLFIARVAHEKPGYLRCIGCKSHLCTQGSTIVNNYGFKSNEELLLSYGFMLPKNLADFFHITLALGASSAGVHSAVLDPDGYAVT